MQMCTLGLPTYEPRSKTQAPAEKKEQLQPRPDPPKTAPKVKPAESQDLRHKTVKPPLTAPSTISIKSQKKEADLVQESEEDIASMPSGEFTKDQLTKAWINMAEQFRSDKNFYFTLKRNKPVLKDKDTIEFAVDNKIQKKEIEDRKMDMMPGIKAELNNYHIRLEVLVNEQEAQSRAYLPQEKFKKMADKNPALKTLKDKLNLEIDF